MIHQPLSIQNVSSMPRYYWHPSVVYVPEGFGGHQWWMAQSPYHPGVELKPYRARWELPCIHWSDEGLHWKAVQTNPIDDLTEQQIRDEDYLSDPHFIYKNGILELYYRLTLLQNKQIEGNKTILYKKTSKDGVNWSKRVVVADLRKKEDVEIWGEQIISQAIVWTGKEYLCWYVDGSGYQKNRGIKMTTSKDGVHWTKAKQCKIVDYGDTPWHIDVQQYDNMFHMLCFGDTKVELAHLVSNDGIEWKFQSAILHPSHKWYSFYSDLIYRSCLVKIDNWYCIFFSAATNESSYIGLMKSLDWEHFENVGPIWNTLFGAELIRKLFQKIIRKFIKVLQRR